MFLKTKLVTTKRNGRCNAYHCQSKGISIGERVVWTLATYREKLIRSVWHISCHTQATTFAPCHAHWLKVQNNSAAMPAQCYDKTTGLSLRREPYLKEHYDLATSE